MNEQERVNSFVESVQKKCVMMLNEVVRYKNDNDYSDLELACSMLEYIQQLLHDNIHYLEKGVKNTKEGE